jgi:dihydrolipoamide dehydrogenase
MKRVDVAIIGAGSAGLSARREVAKKTDNYIVIDNGILGTTCARVGCMPSKVLIQAANDFHRRHKHDEQGIYGSDNLKVEINDVMKHVRKLRDRFVRGVDSGMSSWVSDKHLIRKRASFIDQNTLDLDGEKVHADKIIIATGSTPTIPKNLEEHKEFLLTTDFLFEQTDMPKNILVLGLGVIGIELGQALHRLGVNVLGVARRRIIAGVSDPQLREYVVKKFEEEMNLSFEGIKTIEKVGNQLKITTGDNIEFFADKILVTAGRRPNLDNLNLKAAGVELNKRGLPEFCLETFKIKGTDHLYIVGDVSGQRPILHEASDEGKIAGFNAVSLDHTPFQTRTPMEVSFCDPNVAAAGLSFEELTSQGVNFAVGQVSFEGQGRSIVKLKEIGMLKVYGDIKTGRILGTEMFGPENEHIAHLLAWVISQKMTVNEVLSLPFYHPVIEEGLRTALRDLRDKVEETQPPLETYPLNS